MLRNISNIVLYFGLWWILFEPSFLSAQNHLSRSIYEDDLSAQVIQELGRKKHNQPQGLIIRHIIIQRLEVFLKNEPIWLKANLLHPTTKPWVIQQELRMHVNDRYDESLALESERNLRGIGIFSSVDIVALAVDGKAEQIDILVITRDLWSLRLESAFSFNGGLLDRLQLALVERNFLGHRQNLQLRGGLTPFNVTSGVGLSHGRFWKDLNAGISGGMAWNRYTQKREGYQIDLTLNRPIYNLDQSWAIFSSIGIGEMVNRYTQGRTILAYDDPTSAQVENLPFQWLSRQKNVSLGIQKQLTQSGINSNLTDQRKYRISMSLFAFELENFLPTTLSADQKQDWIQNWIGVSRRSFGGQFGISSFKRQYVTFKNISTFGISEDLNLGLSWSLGSSYSILDEVWSNQAGASWTQLLGTSGFYSFGLSSSIRYQKPFIQSQTPNPDQPNEKAWVNRVLAIQFKFATPVIWIGRFVGSAFLQSRWFDQNRDFLTLGGNQGLRGYQSQAFSMIAADYQRMNLEYRTLAVHYSFIHVGAAVFYDIGGLGKQLASFEYHQGVGAGLRLFLPQFNHGVFRFDWATPIGSDGFTFLLSAGSDQAFAMMPWEN